MAWRDGNLSGNLSNKSIVRQGSGGGMNRSKVALCVSAITVLSAPLICFAQVPDRESSQNPIRDEQRVKQIEAAPSDVADLAKFDHDAEYLPKYVYKRDYEEKRREKQRHHVQVVVGQTTHTSTKASMPQENITSSVNH
jgi:hypothetical protein